MKHPAWPISPAPQPLPILAIGAVIEALVLLPPFPRAKLTDPNISGFMQYFPDFDMLSVEVLADNEPYKVTLNIIFSSKGSFTKPHFRCSTCEMPRDFLVFDRKFICTEDYIKTGSGKSKRERRLRVREARGFLTTVDRRKQSRWVPREQWHEGVRHSDRYLPAVRAAEAARKATSPRPGAQPIESESEYSTERGLALGRGAGQFDAFADYLRNGEKLVAGLWDSRPMIRRPLRPAALAKTPVLDIKALALGDRWPGGDSPLSAFTLQWPDDMNPLVIIDARPSVPFVVVAHRWMDRDRRWQLIKLKVPANGRKRFICPANGRACDQLYLRDGAFASREAHRLFHDSQRGAGRSRAKKQPAK